MFGITWYYPTELNFKDVQKGKYYYEAIQWAYYWGITTGVSSTKFGVGNDCSRGMVVTFLSRYSD